MIRFRWLRGSRSARGTPPLRRPSRRHPFLLPLLTLAVLAQTGCQSGLFGPCGPCANGPVRTFFRQRVLNRGGACCNGAPMVPEAPVIEGAPAVIAPAAPVVTPGSALPAPTEVSPQLEAIPSATPGPAPSSGSSSSGGTQGARAPTGKAYEAARPRYWIGRYRGSNAPRSYAQRIPAPTSRSATGSSATPGPLLAGTRPVEPRANELSLLDNLPPLDLPRDESGAEIKTAGASVEAGEPRPVAVPTPVEARASEPETGGNAAAIPAAVSVAPGLRRFVVVEPKLAGGSLPTTDGLDWLAEKGYKTLVDLREPGEVQPSFIAEVSKRGLRYISLPMSLTSVDNDHVSRFHFEIALADARPLYFFDTDGNRAGMLWFIHRMTAKDDRFDPDEASHQAEELGLGDPTYKKAAQSYLEAVKKAAAPTPAPTPAPAATPAPNASPTSTKIPSVYEPPPVPSPNPVLPDETKLPAKPEALGVTYAASLNVAQGATRTSGNPGAVARDPNAWRPFVSLLLAGLGVPLAYFSRSLISYRGLVRASLPGPRRRLRSLPGGSGE